MAGRVEAADAKPAKKDSRAAARPKEATFTTSVTPAEAKPGETVTYSVTARLEAPWHIYKYSKEHSAPRTAPSTPSSTSSADPAGLKLRRATGPPRSPPIKKKEPAFSRHLPSSNTS